MPNDSSRHGRCAIFDEAELGEHRGGGAGIGTARLGDEPDVLLDREELVERGRLIGEPDLRARRARRGREVLAVDAIGRWLGSTAPAIADERRALAGAVGAEQQRDLAGGELEIEAVDRDALAVLDRELARRCAITDPRCTPRRRGSCACDLRRNARAQRDLLRRPPWSDPASRP